MSAPTLKHKAIIEQINRMRALFTASMAIKGRKEEGVYLVSPGSELSFWLEDPNNAADKAIVDEFSKGLLAVFKQEEESLKQAEESPKFRSVQQDQRNPLFTLTKIQKKYETFLSTHPQLSLKEYIELFMQDDTQDWQKIDALREIAQKLMNFRESEIDEIAKTMEEFGFKAEKPPTRKQRQQKGFQEKPVEEDVLAKKIFETQTLKEYLEYKKLKAQQNAISDPSKSDVIIAVDRMLGAINQLLNRVIEDYSQGYSSSFKDMTVSPAHSWEEFVQLMSKFSNSSKQGTMNETNIQLDAFLDRHADIRRFFWDNITKLNATSDRYNDYLMNVDKASASKKKSPDNLWIASKKHLLSEAKNVYAKLYKEYVDLFVNIDKIEKLDPSSLNEAQSAWLLQAKPRLDLLRSKCTNFHETLTKRQLEYANAVKEWTNKQHLWSKVDEEKYSSLLKNEQWDELTKFMDECYHRGLWNQRYQELLSKSEQISKDNVNLHTKYNNFVALGKAVNESLDAISPRNRDKEQSARRYKRDKAKDEYEALRLQDINAMMNWIKGYGQWTEADEKSAKGWLQPGVDPSTFHQYVYNKYSSLKNEVKNKAEDFEKIKRDNQTGHSLDSKTTAEKPALLFDHTMDNISSERKKLAHDQKNDHEKAPAPPTDNKGFKPPS